MTTTLSSSSSLSPIISTTTTTTNRKALPSLLFFLFLFFNVSVTTTTLYHFFITGHLRWDDHRRTTLRSLSSSSSSDPRSIDWKIPVSEEKDFLEIGLKHQTAKVTGYESIKENEIEAINPKCRTSSHFFHTLYQKRLGPYSIDHVTGPFLFIEIGYFQGKGYETYREFLSTSAEVHSIELACVDYYQGPNYSAANPNTTKYIEDGLLHCGDASNVNFLYNVWTNQLRGPRPNPPPLKVVVDDASHFPEHMLVSLLFWFPRIEPGGLFIMEDIVPARATNLFRTSVLPQLMSDLHFCGVADAPDQRIDFENGPCFPTIQKFLMGIDCEMHICVFERNDVPSEPEYPLSTAVLPEHAFDAMKNCPVLAASSASYNGKK